MITCAGMVLPVPLGTGTETPAGITVALQLKVVPVTLELKVMGADKSPEQMVWAAGLMVRSGAGFTVIT